MKKLLAFIIFLGIVSESKAQFFAEENGVIKIEMENTPLVGHWHIKTDVSGFSGTGYLVWTGSEYFNNTNNGNFEYKIKISNPGVYQFRWYTRVGKGTNNTEHNDTWLKIDGALDFYGQNSSGHIVRPKGVCTNDCPNGSGLNGYFKVYGAKHNVWEWRASTSDNDAHNVFAHFENPGIYSIKIAARSSYHLLDKLVLFHTTLSSQAVATNPATPFSEWFPFTTLQDTVVIKNTNLVLPIENVHSSVRKIEAEALNADLIKSTTVSEIIDGEASLSISLHDDETGISQIKLIVTDDSDQKIEMFFNLTVIDFINQAPTIDQIDNIETDYTDEIKTINFTGISDGDDGSQNISVSVNRSPFNIVAQKELIYSGGDSAIFKYQPLKAGLVNITVTIEDNGGVLLGGNDKKQMKFTILVNDITAIEEQEVNDVIIFPNPSSGIVWLKTENGTKLQQLKVYNSKGQKIDATIVYSQDEANIDLRGFAVGCYVLHYIVNGRPYAIPIFKI